MDMPKNLASWDRAARVVIGLALIALVFVGPKTAWGWVGLIPLVSAVVGFCPAYKLFGINTNKGG